MNRIALHLLFLVLVCIQAAGAADEIAPADSGDPSTASPNVTDSSTGFDQPDSTETLSSEAAEQDVPATENLLGLAEKAFLEKDYEKCIEHVIRAQELGQTLPLESVFHLGSSYGRTSDYQKAVAALSAYEIFEGDEALKKRMKAQVSFYEEKLFAEIAAKAASTEQAGDTAGLDDRLIAVIPFQNVSKDSTLDPLQKGLADMVITDLSQVKALKVVERVQVAKLMQELSMDQAGLTEKADRARVARLLKAGYVVGGIFKLGDSTTLKIRGGYVNSKTMEIVGATPVSGDMAKFFDLEKQFVFGVIEKMGIMLSDEEREQIHVIATENLLAFMAYAEGLDAQDKGDYSGAQRAFQKAAKIDPSFEQAREMADVMDASASMEDEAVADLEEEMPEAQEDEAPVAFEGSGPAQVVEAAEKLVAEPAPASLVIATAPQPRPAIRAGSSVARRSATLAGASFMSELGVQTGREEVADNATEGQEVAVEQESVEIANEQLNYERPDYADYKGLGFGDTKPVEITVELPDMVVP